ncbi:MAG: hypothetical protein IPG89_07420 [Bacteroidetes bacterium]|nr:hypothetical protein [Bacteroidota bacterium]
MKRKILTLTACVLTITVLTAQTKSSTATPVAKTNQPIDSCGLLKKQNETLKKILNLGEPLIYKINNDVEFKITKVRGDIQTQMVTIDILMINLVENRELSVTNQYLKIVTLEGDVLKLSSSVVGGTGYATNVYLNTSIPIKSTFTFGTLLPSNEYIKLFNFAFTILHPQDYHQNKTGAIEFKDLKIEWK